MKPLVRIESEYLKKDIILEKELLDTIIGKFRSSLPKSISDKSVKNIVLWCIERITYFWESDEYEALLEKETKAIIDEETNSILVLSTEGDFNWSFNPENGFNTGT